MNKQAVLGLGFVAAILLLSPAAPAQARVDCHPYCDFNHDYGPYDVGWQRPGLTCYPRCDARGRCAPTPTCVVVSGVAGQSSYASGWLDGRRPAGRVTVRPRRPAP
jgi:hypothetical protein